MGNIQATAEAQYKTMTQKDIESLPVGEIADDNSILFLWATFPKMQEALDTIKAWGFEYKTIGFNWTKLNKNGEPFFGVGWYTKCIDSQSKVFVLNLKENKVEYLTIKELHNKDFKNYKIHSENGWKQIYNVVNQGKKESVKINTELGNFYCSKNHKLFYKYVSQPRNKKNKNKRDTIHKLGCSEIDIIEDKWKKHKTKGFGCNLIYPKNKVENLNPFKKINNFNLTNNLAWILGLFVAEGNYGSGSSKNQINYSLCGDEKHFYEKIKKYIENLGMFGDRYFNFPIKVNLFEHKDKNGISVYFTKKIFKDLFGEFILNKGSHFKRLNLELLLQTSVKFRENFLKGILDGDGTKHFKKGIYQGRFRKINLCNKELISDIKILCESLGIMTRPLEGYTWNKNIRNGFKFSNYGLSINKDKYNHKFEELKCECDMVTINSFENSHKKELYDISVEDGTFIFDGILSHNSNGEMCLIGTKGRSPKVSNSVSNVIQTVREKHSKKPDIVRDKIVEFCGDVPRIELFGREKVEGWDVLGNDIDGKDIRDSLKELIKK